MSRKNQFQRKVVIAVAPVKHSGTELPSECSNPTSAQDIANETIACSDEGASLVHLHVRDQNGELTPDLTQFNHTIELIREKSDIIIQGSTGGLSSQSLEERCVSLTNHDVEMASLNMGSVNFGEGVYINTILDIRYWAKAMKDKKIVPELEIFDLSMIETVQNLISENLLSGPFHYNFCLGVENALSANAENLYHLKSAIRQDSKWGLSITNMTDFSLLTTAVTMGAQIIRVGYEDSCLYGPGKIASSNQYLVKKLTEIVQILGFEIASIEEAREMLKIPLRKIK